MQYVTISNITHKINDDQNVSVTGSEENNNLSIPEYSSITITYPQIEDDILFVQNLKQLVIDNKVDVIIDVVTLTADEVGFLNGTFQVAEQILYGTGAPPSPTGLADGTVYLRYIP